MSDHDRKRINKTAKQHGWVAQTVAPNSETVHFTRTGDETVVAGSELATFYFNDDHGMRWAFVQRPSGVMIGNYVCQDSLTTTDISEAVSCLSRPSVVDVKAL